MSVLLNRFSFATAKTVPVTHTFLALLSFFPVQYLDAGQLPITCFENIVHILIQVFYIQPYS